MIETMDRKRLEERDCENLDIFFGASTCAIIPRQQDWWLFEIDSEYFCYIIIDEIARCQLSHSIVKSSWNTSGMAATDSS